MNKPIVDFDIIVQELSYRLTTGQPNFNNEEHLDILIDILKECGWPEKAITAFITKLILITEAESIAAQKAKKAGLKSAGYGWWEDPKTGKTVAKSTNGGKTLTKVDGRDSKKDNKKQTPQKKNQVKPIGQKTAPTDKKAKATKIDNKDKTLQKVDTLKSEAFNETIKPSPGDFETSNQPYYRDVPPPHFKSAIDPQTMRFPRKYLDVIERMVNTKFNPSGATSKITHFIEGAGAGAIRSQAGEILTMALSTMNDKDARTFYDTLRTHIKETEKNDKNTLVTSGWLDAAMNNRTAILNNMKKHYPEGSQMVAGAWDVEGEVEAMGLKDYKTNKGYSTDVYFKVKLPTGETVIDEWSLKKDENVNFANASVGSYLEWDKNLPDDINIKVYAKNQKQRLENFLKTNSKAANKFLANKEVQSILKSKKIDAKNIDDIINGRGDQRSKNKIMYEISKQMATSGSNSAKQFVKSHEAESKIFEKNTINAVANNEKIKEGILSSIRTEFPLKAVASGEEKMAVGKLSLDKYTLKEIFGTDDYNKIKDKLVVRTDKEPPYIAYRAQAGKTEVPIAILKTREDGVGYGGAFKFELKLDKRFAKAMAEANKKIYGE